MPSASCELVVVADRLERAVEVVDRRQELLGQLGDDRDPARARRRARRACGSSRSRPGCAAREPGIHQPSRPWSRARAGPAEPDVRRRPRRWVHQRARRRRHRARTQARARAQAQARARARAWTPEQTPPQARAGAAHDSVPSHAAAPELVLPGAPLLAGRRVGLEPLLLGESGQVLRGGACRRLLGSVMPLALTCGLQRLLRKVLRGHRHLPSSTTSASTTSSSSAAAAPLLESSSPSKSGPADCSWARWYIASETLWKEALRASLRLLISAGSSPVSDSRTALIASSISTREDSSTCSPSSLSWRSA